MWYLFTALTFLFIGLVCPYTLKFLDVSIKKFQADADKAQAWDALMETTSSESYSERIIHQLKNTEISTELPFNVTDIAK